MPAGVVLNLSPSATNLVDDVVDQARRAYGVGVRQIWLAQHLVLSQLRSDPADPQRIWEVAAAI